MLALDVFGGREVVLAKLTEMFATRVAELDDETKAGLGERIGVNLSSFGPHKEQISWEMFHRCDGPLNISVFDALVDPDLTDDSVRRAWAAEMVESPIAVSNGPRPGMEEYLSIRAVFEIEDGALNEGE